MKSDGSRIIPVDALPHRFECLQAFIRGSGKPKGLLIALVLEGCHKKDALVELVDDRFGFLRVETAPTLGGHALEAVEYARNGDYQRASKILIKTSVELQNAADLYDDEDLRRASQQNRTQSQKVLEQ